MNLPALPSLTSIVARHGLATKKSLGQHFLLNESVTDEIVRYAGDMSRCNVIEIGPGPGGLTRSLLRAGAKQLFVVEKDDRCIEVMRELQQVAGEKLQILHEDALSVDLITLVAAPRKIVANLPYNSGTQMLINWLDVIYKQGANSFDSLTLMFQKEVAERITATHGNKDYGRLSVLAQWLCEVRYDMELPPEAFTPPPKVTSSVVTLIPRVKPLVEVSKPALEKLVAAAFNQRRKMLRSALKSLGCDVEKLLAKAAIDPTLRAEQLNVTQLCHLARCYEQL